MNNLPESIVRSNDVINKNVYDNEMKSLGKIEEIVLDKVSGQVRYVVLSFGGFLGFGDKYFAFPWKSISYSKELEGFILNVPKEKLKDDYGFDKDNWPDMATWANTVSTRYF